MDSNDSLENLNDYEKLIDELGREIASLYEICGAIKELMQQTDENSETYKQFGTFFYMFYRLCYYEIYHGIARLLDETKGVLSIIKLFQLKDKPIANAELAAMEKEFADKLKKNEIAKKVKEFRNKKLGHKNKRLILDNALENNFRKDNKIEIDDIEALLHLIGTAIQLASERAGFHILTLPETSIRMEISNIFELLSAKYSEANLLRSAEID
jgi:hypothetical protein